MKSGDDKEVEIRPETDVLSHVLTFMYQSISDMQATVRLIDTKLGFILILNIIPITNVGVIYSEMFRTLSADNGCIVQIFKCAIVVMCVILWILACVCTYRGIAAIDNPMNHIKVLNEQANGAFYSGGLYGRSLIDAIFNRSSVLSKKTFTEYCEDMPATDDQIFKELAFDKMKLAYIRDTKLLRQKWAFRFTICWIYIGFFIYAAIVRKTCPLLSG